MYHICFVYIYPLNGYQELNSFEGPCFFFRKLYLSHFIWNGCERVMCERWVGDWIKTATYWPPVPLSLVALLSRSAGLLNRVAWGPSPLLRAGSHRLELQQLTPTDWTSCRTGLYHYLTSSCFLWASHLHPIQPVQCQGCTLISSTGYTYSLIDGWVGGQYVTTLQPNNKHSKQIGDYYCYYSLQVFHANIIWWSFTTVLMIRTLFESSGFFSVF